MSNEHFPSHAKEKSPTFQMSDEYVNEQFDEIASLYDETEAEEPTYEKLLEHTKQVHDMGEAALEAAGVAVESVGPMTTEERFWNTSPDEMDKMSDEEILDNFYRPEEIGLTASTQVSSEVPRYVEESPASPSASRYETQSPRGPEVYKKFSGEQLEQIKLNLLDSFAETLSGMSDARNYNTDAAPSEVDLERISQNLIDITLEMESRTPEGTANNELSSQDEGLYSPSQLSENEIQTILDKLPKDKKMIIPIYRMEIRLRGQADDTKDKKKKQSFLDRTNIFNSLASRLMLGKAPGWDDVYVSSLRLWHAAAHPELNNS